MSQYWSPELEVICGGLWEDLQVDCGEGWLTLVPDKKGNKVVLGVMGECKLIMVCLRGLWECVKLAMGYMKHYGMLREKVKGRGRRELEKSGKETGEKGMQGSFCVSTGLMGACLAEPVSWCIGFTWQGLVSLLHLEEEVEKSGVKLSRGRWEEWGEGVFRLVLISHCPTVLQLIGNKLN